MVTRSLGFGITLYRGKVSMRSEQMPEKRKQSKLGMDTLSIAAHAPDPQEVDAILGAPTPERVNVDDFEVWVKNFKEISWATSRNQRLD